MCFPKSIFIPGMPLMMPALNVYSQWAGALHDWGDLVIEYWSPNWLWINSRWHNGGDMWLMMDKWHHSIGRTFVCWMNVTIFVSIVTTVTVMQSSSTTVKLDVYPGWWCSFMCVWDDIASMCECLLVCEYWLRQEVNTQWQWSTLWGDIFGSFVPCEMQSPVWVCGLSVKKGNWVPVGLCDDSCTPLGEGLKVYWVPLLWLWSLAKYRVSAFVRQQTNDG